jgi:hypothetical protein
MTRYKRSILCNNNMEKNLRNLKGGKYGSR